MLRRDFLKTTGAALAFSAMPAYAQQFSDMKKRVALIGTGWYGKSDLFRLLQVAPVEVVSLCDADSNLLNECADMCAERQLSKKRPRTYKHYQELLDQKDVDIALIATPGSLARAADDRGGQGRLRHLRPEADQRRHPRGPGDAGGGAQVQARRPGRHAAPQHAAPDHRPRSHRPRRQARHRRPGRDLLLLRDAGDAEPAGRAAAAQPRLRAVDRAGPDAPVQRPGAPAEVARLHGVRQRHRRRHVRAHARHGALDARSRDAQPRRVVGRHPRPEDQPRQHHRHADGDLRLRRTCR